MTTPNAVAINPDRTAVLIMDFQQRIIANVASEPDAVVANAAAALDAARAAGIPVFYIVHRGGPFAEYAPDVEIHPGVAPADGEPVITKVRPGPFSTTALDVTLRAAGRDTLVIMGVATSGCVLSGVRWAVDINYSCIVLADACSDADPEVHRVLTEKVYPRQGRVIAVSEFLESVRALPPAGHASIAPASTPERMPGTGTETEAPLLPNPSDAYLREQMEWAISCWPARRRRELRREGKEAVEEFIQSKIRSTRALAQALRLPGGPEDSVKMAIRMEMLELEPD